MTDIAIGIGANENAAHNIQFGIDQLHQQMEILQVSALYQSSATQGPDVADYLNAAVLARTSLPPVQIKALLTKIEDAAGRVRGATEGQKGDVVALDFDLWLYGDVPMTYICNGKLYQLPHEDLLKYAHAIVPLAQIAPDWIHPQTGQTLAEIARRFRAVALKKQGHLVLR